MRAAVLVTLATGALAARPYINEPDTGIEDVLGDTPQGTLANITGLVGLPDFEWAARRYLPIENYTYYMNGAGGEWSARNNLEVYHRYNWRARQLVDITNIPATLPYVFSLGAAQGPRWSVESLTPAAAPPSWVTTFRPPSSSRPARVVSTATPMLS